MPELKSIRFEATAEVSFTREEVAALQVLSARHYDPTCQSLSKDGVINGLANSFHAGLDRAEWNLKFREIDLLRKCCEIAGYAKEHTAIGAQIWLKLGQVLGQLDRERERVNAPQLRVEVFYDPDAQREGQRGCYRARLKENHEIHDAGSSALMALRHLLRTAEALGRDVKNFAVELK